MLRTLLQELVVCFLLLSIEPHLMRFNIFIDLCISYSTWQCLEKELLNIAMFEIDVAVEWNY